MAGHGQCDAVYRHANPITHLAMHVIVDIQYHARPTLALRHGGLV